MLCSHFTGEDTGLSFPGQSAAAGAQARAWTVSHGAAGGCTHLR